MIMTILVMTMMTILFDYTFCESIHGKVQITTLMLRRGALCTGALKSFSAMMMQSQRHVDNAMQRCNDQSQGRVDRVMPSHNDDNSMRTMQCNAILTSITGTC